MARTVKSMELFEDPQAPVQPNQFRVEFQALLEIFRAIKPERILEVGIHSGGSLYQWMKNAPGSLVVGVDVENGPWGDPGTTDLAAWMQWAEFYGVNFQPILASSQESWVVEKVLAYGPYDFIFLDGDHSYQAINHDFFNYSAMLAPGGVVALHDILQHPDDPQIQVWKLWAEISLIFETEEITSHPFQKEKGIGICRPF